MLKPLELPVTVRINLAGMAKVDILGILGITVLDLCCDRVDICALDFSALTDNVEHGFTIQGIKKVLLLA